MARDGHAAVARGAAPQLSARGLATTALTLVAGGVAGGVAAATLLALAPWWPLTLFEHFRVQYLLLAIPCAAVALALRRWRLFDLAAIAMLLNVIVLGASLGGAGPPPAPGAVPLRVLSLNVHTASTAHDRVRALIDELAPDVVALTEVDARWLEALAPSLAGYLGRVEHPRADNFGIALYHRRPLRRAEVIEPGDGLPTIIAALELDGADVTVIVTHPMPPVSARGAAQQRRQLDAIAARVRALPGPRVLLGDLNATPWSRPFQRLRRGAGLRDSLEDRPAEPTYPTSFPLLGIPIDHALVSAEVAVRRRRVERDVGSDHWPLYLELAIAPRAP